MNSASKWIFQALGPAVVLLLLGGMIWWSGRKAEENKGPAAPAKETAAAPATPPPPSRVDFSTLQPGGTVPDWNTSQGTFRLVTHEGRTVMELSHEPMVEGRLVWNRIFKSQGTILARVWGERTRRTAPRFALGVAGSSAGFWFRAIPTSAALQMVGPEEKVLASAPWEWDASKPVWLELKVLPAPEGTGSLLEGRVWPEGGNRPEAPSLALPVAADLGFARATVAAAPYALQPVYFDHLEVASP